VRLICREDADFPPGLRQVPDVPIVLYVRGELRPTDAVAIAIVGSRRCTIYGSEQARRFGELLASAGFTVVSGLARGIDPFAHHGAVDAGGRSIAVMGNGLHEVYPAENRTLAEKLLESGAWISELPIRAAVRAENFPSRNRIIAGMTLGTIVVEAANRSGALITARLANEYNREVFAVPGRAQDPMSGGTNALIRDGSAKLVTCLEDVLQELGDVGARLGAKPPAADPRPAVQEALSVTALERCVLDAVGPDPMLQDGVLSAVDGAPGELLAAITSLELKGLIRRLPGSMVVRVSRPPART
jgi:DNA processing protein